MPDQVFLAKVFNEQYQEVIEASEILIKTSAIDFLNSFGKVCFQPDVVRRLIELALNGNFNQVYSYMRGKVPDDVETKVRSMYWSVLDSMSAHMDAIGSYWPYMTESTRLWRLEHAKVHLSELQAMKQC